MIRSKLWVNRGVIEGHELGVVTSASLMVRWPAAAEAAAYGREHSTLSLGIHIDLGEWAYREGTWVQLYDVVPLDDIEAVKKRPPRSLQPSNGSLARVRLTWTLTSMSICDNFYSQSLLKQLNASVFHCGVVTRLCAIAANFTARHGRARRS